MQICLAMWMFVRMTASYRLCMLFGTNINELVLEYTDLFDGYDDIIKFTLDGTLNYVLGLFIDKLNYMYENNGE